MSKFNEFDPDKYLAKKQQAFDPDAYLQINKPVAEDDSLLEQSKALGLGVASGASLNLADELYGAAAGSPMGALKSLKGLTGEDVSSDKDVQEYQAKRDEARKVLEEYAKKYPKTTMVGELAGGIGLGAATGVGIPAKVAQLGKIARMKEYAKAAGLAGLLYGPGGSNADLTKGEAGTLAADTAISGGLGAATGGAGSVIGPKAGSALGAGIGYTSGVMSGDPDSSPALRALAGAVIGRGIGASNARELAPEIDALKKQAIEEFGTKAIGPLDEARLTKWAAEEKPILSAEATGKVEEEAVKQKEQFNDTLGNILARLGKDVGDARAATPQKDLSKELSAIKDEISQMSVPNPRTSGQLAAIKEIDSTLASKDSLNAQDLKKLMDRLSELKRNTGTVQLPGIAESRVRQLENQAFSEGALPEAKKQFGEFSSALEGVGFKKDEFKNISSEIVNDIESSLNTGLYSAETRLKVKNLFDQLDKLATTPEEKEAIFNMKKASLAAAGAAGGQQKIVGGGHNLIAHVKTMLGLGGKAGALYGSASRGMQELADKIPYSNQAGEIVNSAVNFADSITNSVAKVRQLSDAEIMNIESTNPKLGQQLRTLKETTDPQKLNALLFAVQQNPDFRKVVSGNK